MRTKVKHDLAREVLSRQGKRRRLGTIIEPMNETFLPTPPMAFWSSPGKLSLPRARSAQYRLVRLCIDLACDVHDSWTFGFL